jgi:hypothetical protein
MRRLTSLAADAFACERPRGVRTLKHGHNGWVLQALLEPGLASSVTNQIITMFRDGFAGQGLWPK